MTGRIPGTGHIERIEFNAEGEQKRERLLVDLHQRVRDVQQGQDGLIYVLTEEREGALLVLEPAP
jgi:glucose/arabinose dehydrogenase